MVKKGNIPWNKGLTKETDDRVLRITHKLKGRKKTFEERQKQSETRMKRINCGEITIWNKGLKGIHLSPNTEYKKGSVPWSKGKHIRLNNNQAPRKKGYKIRADSKTHSEETRKKMSESHKGKLLSEEQKKKIGDSNRGQKRSDGFKEECRIRRLKQVLPQKDTTIERILQSELNKNNILYKKHVPILGICQPDIVFPEKKVVVFVDGDYWHNLPKRIESDKRQNIILKENGWEVLRFWEHEIKNNINKCTNIILGVLI